MPTDSPFQAQQKQPQTCVVVGAGIGGLVAAAALSPIFNSVIVIEKDNLQNSPVLRKSTPQSNHLHSLLAAGLNILEGFFPGISVELIANGARTLRAGVDQQIHEYGAWMPQRDLNLSLSSQSRPLLEHIIRSRVKALGNVQIREKMKAEKLVYNNAGGVCGIEIAGNSTGEVVTLDSDIVVDASGIGGPFIRMLTKQFPEIDESKEVLDSKIVYASALISKPEEYRDIHENVLIIAQPDQFCGGALTDVEDNKWMVSLHGRNGLKPPTDPAAWKAFAKTLPSSRIWERIKDAEVIGKVHVFNKPTSFLRRFDKVQCLPQGYFPLGDIINSINPTFGQGMTIAFGHAKILGETFLSADVEDQQKHYIEQATKWSQKAWRRTVIYDSMFAENSAIDQKKIDVVRKLALASQEKAHADPKLHLQSLLQAQMLN